MDMSDVSIIVPVYNAEKYISECIESILKQSYKDFELILVDDGSTDKSSVICEEYANKDSRIRYIYKKNGGVSSARNTGITAATGKYIAFVDSDDFIKEDMISILLKNDVDFSMCGYELYNGFDDVILSKYPCPQLWGSTKELAKHIDEYLSPPFLLGPCFKMFKREIVKTNNIQFPLELSYGEDAVFVFKYLMHCFNFNICSYIGYSYRKHGNETLSNRFLVDKIDINNHINGLIETFLKKEECLDFGEITSKRLLSNFVAYTEELVNSGLSLKKKKEIFIEKATKYKNHFSKPSKLTELVVYLVAFNKVPFALVYAFRLKHSRK